VNFIHFFKEYLQNKYTNKLPEFIKVILYKSTKNIRISTPKGFKNKIKNISNIQIKYQTINKILQTMKKQDLE